MTTRHEPADLNVAPEGAPRYIPSPTMEDFILAVRQGALTEMRVVILLGSRGEGKTCAATMSFLLLADRVRREVGTHALPVVVGCIRDTWENLRRTTIVSLETTARMQGLQIQWRNDQHEAVFHVGGQPAVHIYFFGLDRPADADKLQGFTCGVLWAEEVAPAAGLEAGVPAESIGIGSTSVRQDFVPPRIVITMNPPDRDHWIMRAEETLRDANLKDFVVVRFDVPSGEKARHFEALAAEAASGDEQRHWTQAARAFSQYRARMKAMLEATGRMDLVARLVEGQIGDVQVGEAVVKHFSRLYHVTNDPLPVFQGLPIVRGWDGGGCPSCVIFQNLPGNRGVNVLGSHCAENTTMELFIRDWLMPWMMKYRILPPRQAMDATRGARGGYTFRDIVDPSMQWEGGTVRTDNVSVRVLEAMLGAACEPGPVEWAARREALNMAFWRPGVGDRPRFVQIERSENDTLIAALAGRFRYPKMTSTNKITMTVEAAKRVSGIYSGPPDALGYGLAVLHPAVDWLKAAVAAPAPTVTRPPKSWLGV